MINLNYKNEKCNFFFAPIVKPVFTTKPTCTLIEPTLLQCQCDGVGIPDPSIQWIVKGETDVISSQSQLNITLGKDTEGNYTCSLTNLNGVESEHLDISKYGIFIVYSKKVIL